MLACPAVPTRAPGDLATHRAAGSVPDQRLPEAAAWGGYPGGLAGREGRRRCSPASTVPEPSCRDAGSTTTATSTTSGWRAARPRAIAAARAAGVDRHDHRRHRRRRAAAMAIDVAAAARRRVGDRRAAPPRRERRRRHDRAAARRARASWPIGECGLDYHYDHSPRDVQRDGVRRADRARPRATTSPLVIHTREAWDDTFDVLARRGRARRARSSTASPAAPTRPGACLDLGAYLSFSGIVTFKSADDVRAAAALCPLDRLLVETDAPVPRARAAPGQAQPAGVRAARRARDRRAAGHRRRRGGRRPRRAAATAVFDAALGSPPRSGPRGKVELWRSLPPSGVASPQRCSSTVAALAVVLRVARRAESTTASRRQDRRRQRRVASPLVASSVREHDLAGPGDRRSPRRSGRPPRHRRARRSVATTAAPTTPTPTTTATPKPTTTAKPKPTTTATTLPTTTVLDTAPPATAPATSVPADPATTTIAVHVQDGRGTFHRYDNTDPHGASPCAHRTLPKGTVVTVTNADDGRVDVRAS